MFQKLRIRAFSWYHTKVSLVPPPNATEQELELYRLIDKHEELRRNNRLLKLALKYDLDLTGHPEIFENEQRGHLTPHGRATLRSLIHEEKERRFENVARWVKLLAPLIGTLAGLLGVLTGLAAVLQHKK